MSVDSLCTRDISNLFFIFSIFLAYVVHLGAFFKLSRISKIFSNRFIGKDMHISGPMQICVVQGSASTHNSSRPATDHIPGADGRGGL